MRIQLRKISDREHELAIVRDDGQRESVTCETRSLFMHDLIHYAVEGAAAIETGFWGRLAHGRTLAEMNDRAGLASADEATELATVERFVGALSSAAKGVAAADVVAGIERYANALGSAPPPWLTEPLVLAVQEHLRRLTGAWRATPHGETLDLAWPPVPSPRELRSPRPAKRGEGQG